MISLKSLLVSAVVTMTCLDAGQTVQNKMVSELEIVRNIFENNYAPYQWKHEHFNWELEQEFENAKNQILATKPNVKAYQGILKNFFSSTRDYHVGVYFYSTEASILPFSLKSAEGKYYVTGIDDSMTLPFKVGDEILEFNGKPIDAAVNEFRLKEMNGGSLLTDKALAELHFTLRAGLLGMEVPKGPVQIKFKGKKTSSCQLEWEHAPEKIHNPSKSVAKKAIKKKALLDKRMVTYFYPSLYDKRFCDSSELGSRESFLPKLGNPVWESESDSFFHAYIFENKGKRVGYLRIPSYDFVEEIEEFEKVIAFLETNTDTLVIDQLNNPGGYVTAVYDALSFLATSPIRVPLHQMMLTQADAFEAVCMLEATENGDSVEDLQGVGIENLRAFYEKTLQEWNEGHTMTSPLAVFGIESIQPKPVHYSKPILVLVNELDFSGGDFFPAILQDNKRATIFGAKTSGAGGIVSAQTHANHMGIIGYNWTISYALRMNNKPIENLGVTPDISYEVTGDDLRHGYKDYIKAVLKAIK